MFASCSFVKCYFFFVSIVDSIEQMVSNFVKKLEISPSLKDIVNLFGEDNKRPADTFSSSQRSVEPDNEAYDDNEFNDGGHDNSETWDFINDNQTNVNDECTYEDEDDLFVPVHHEVSQWVGICQNGFGSKCVILCFDQS